MIPTDPRLPHPPRLEEGYLAKLLVRLIEIFREIAQTVNRLESGYQSQSITVTQSGTIADVYTHVFVNTASGAVTVTIGRADQLRGKTIVIQKVSTNANAVTIQSANGNIDGSASINFTTSLGTRVLASDGSNFYTVV